MGDCEVENEERRRRDLLNADTSASVELHEGTTHTLEEERIDGNGIDIKKPVQRPDRSELDANVLTLNNEVQEIIQQLQEVDIKIAEAKVSSGDQSEELREARAVVKTLREKKDVAMRERQEIAAQQRAARVSLEGKLQQQKSLRAELKYTSPDEIEKRIRDLEHKQSTTSMSLRDEKNLLKEIEQLKQSKKLVNHLAANTDSISSEKKQSQSISEQLQIKNAELDELKQQIEEQKSLLDVLNEANSERRAVLPSLYKQKDSLRKEKSTRVEKIKSLRNDFKLRDEEYRAYQRELRRMREEAKKAEQEARRAEIEKKRKEAEEEELKRVPYEEEMELCSYLVNFLQTTYPIIVSDQGRRVTGLESKECQPEDQKTAGLSNMAEFEGLVMAGKTAALDEDEYCSLNKQFGRKKGRGKKRGGLNVVDKISLVPETIEIFGILNLEPPTTVAGVAKAIDDLEAKKAWFAKQPRGAVPSIRDKQKAEESRQSRRDDGTHDLRDELRSATQSGVEIQRAGRSASHTKADKRSKKNDGFNAADAADEAFPQLPGSAARSSRTPELAMAAVVGGLVKAEHLSSQDIKSASGDLTETQETACFGSTLTDSQQDEPADVSVNDTASDGGIGKTSVDRDHRCSTAVTDG